jgi:hypothetical protein
MGPYSPHAIPTRSPAHTTRIVDETYYCDSSRADDLVVGTCRSNNRFVAMRGDSSALNPPISYTYEFRIDGMTSPMTYHHPPHASRLSAATPAPTPHPLHLSIGLAMQRHLPLLPLLLQNHGHRGGSFLIRSHLVDHGFVVVLVFQSAR